MEALVIGIALLSYILSYIVLGLGFKYIEKHPASKENGVTIFLVRRIVILFIFIVQALLLAVPLFICIEAFPMLIIGIIYAYKDNSNPFINTKFN